MPVEREPVLGELEEITYGIEKRVTFQPSEKGSLALFRRPQPGKEYVAGMDVAEGIDANDGDGEPDSDFSVCSVFERDTGDQVARLRVRMQPAPFGAYVYHLLRWYNNAGLVPKANGPGLWAITEITNRGYPASRIYHRKQRMDQDPQTRADDIGWKTSSVTRPMMLSALDRALRELAISIHDPVSVQELMTFVIKPNGKPEASRGNHDDTVIANALAVIGIAEMPRLPRPQNYDAVKKYGQRGDSRVTGRGTRRPTL